MRHLRNQIQRLIRDTAGNILPLAAVGMVVAAMVVGSGIDLSRDYKARNQLQAACDAGVLAGRRTVTTKGFDTASSTAAQNYFVTNFDDNAQETSGTVFTPSSTDSGQTVNGVATTTLNTLVMKLFGFNSFNISVSCTSSMSVGNADVMMVLDTTGSMSSALGKTTRIKSLQSAMKNFYTTLYNATAGTKARVRYGFVPYSSTVNVGRLLYALNPAYLADSNTYQSRKWFSDTSTGTGNSSSTGWVQGSTSYRTQDLCNKDLPSSNSDYSNNGSSKSSSSTTNGVTTNTVTQPQKKTSYKCDTSNSKWYIYTKTDSQDSVTTTTSGFYYQPVSLPTNVFKTFAPVSTQTGDNGAMQSFIWDGCIEERSTSNTSSFSYSTVSGYSPSNAYDINIDMAPTTDSNTQWAPQWYQISYIRGRNAASSTSYWTQGTTTEGDPVTEYCPAKAQLLTEMSQTDFNTYANSLVANGGTYLDIGMIWGGRMISQDGIFKDNVNTAPSNKGEVSRHIIFMTDGEMDTSRQSTSAWGLDWWDRRVTTDGSETTADARHTSRFRAVCDAIKAKGVRIWVIAFTSSLSSDLSYCATENSSYTASNSTELNTAFQEIAKQVGELRITQ